LEDVDVCGGNTVLKKVDDKSALFFGESQGILGQQLWPHPIHLTNIITIILFAYYMIKVYF
jgi:hypothetical protein